ncbi:glutamine--tRNA ligase/YqeY domain fusion protein [Geoalkalibacter halelectricus]|uniref:Glutamine--tRNA ligase n=1 Tax=Geoalkalibacter halelectricus TaxID=2847045 RepID=A0ABY5ZMP4_9BACT|nr:glutamine--tRNA ligase/YqeY domain fusion protein [Geoalkalibacter halelectricus]MDO3378337.1 glutamine--tRNA ligase/YqeY domain fusion protein [Geoalkalibacter halelectricus]UWZ80343.1 glutamine--tRNA ligase/YqeY domain fusion protein [Geoalkalibacter halelectricus]
MSTPETTPPATNFIRNLIDADLAAGARSEVVTRFPPEPNGYLHIGHAKAICLNFGLAAAYGGRCHLRMDDTNPEKESIEYAEAIQDVVRWLGFDWGTHLYFASDYYEQLYLWAEELIRRERAYVDSLDAEQMRAHRGTLTEPGRESPDRDRPAAESLDLFRRMRAGEFPDGAYTLRARIDMASPNMNLRDPVIYRIQRHHHYRTGDAWCIYPMYDYAHPLSDAIEGITHSICTLEFEDHRPLYDWFLEQLADLLPARPRQVEFARLNLSYTLMSKRRLLELVREGLVAGWDDPRMPTLVGLRRRGFTPAAIRAFCERIGVGKSDSWIDMSVLEDCLREDLNQGAPRALAVLNPLKVVLTDYPEEREEFFDAANHPQQPEEGSRQVPFCREFYIERDDFMEEPPKKFFRLAPGREVRLRFGYIIRCEEVVKDPVTGEVVELRCTHDPATLGANPADGRKVKGTIHWVSARHGVPAEVRLYDRLFAVPTPGAGREGRDWRADLNPHSLTTLRALIEPGLAQAAVGTHVQFERLGYFFVDPHDSTPGRPVFNRAATLRDSWAKLEAGGS